MKRILYRALTETLKMAAVAGGLLAIAAVDAGAQNAPGGLLTAAAWLLGITLHKRKDRRQLTETTI